MKFYVISNLDEAVDPAQRGRRLKKALKLISGRMRQASKRWGKHGMHPGRIGGHGDPFETPHAKKAIKYQTKHFRNQTAKANSDRARNVGSSFSGPEYWRKRVNKAKKPGRNKNSMKKALRYSLGQARDWHAQARAAGHKLP